MADLLIELVGEEIPARMQTMAAQHFATAVKTALDDLGVWTDAASIDGLCGPRHLAVYARGIAVSQPDRMIEKRGPRVDAPEAAIAGFVASAGVPREALIEEDTPKGRFFFARNHVTGADTKSLLGDVVTSILTEFPWPKSQRWGRGSFRWVRPLHRINILFDGDALAGSFDLGGGDALTFGTTSCGHYFESPGDISLEGVGSVDDFKQRLALAHVIIDQSDRRAAIIDGARSLAKSVDCTVNEAQLGGYIQDIAGLVESPTALLGQIEDRFMKLPPELLQATIATHQKYITLQDLSGNFSPYFIVVSNRQADPKRDQVIMAGNQRVLRARLADAEFFWQQDQKQRLESYVAELQAVTFYEGLGDLHAKAVRLEKLATVLAPYIAGCDAQQAGRAGVLAKADLVTGMVGEFPELQGIIGGYYARHDGEADSVASAIATHYRPQGPTDDVPETPTAKAVALADKIDTLVGFFGIGAKPTGSKDPFALRRAALGVIRIILDAELSLPLATLLQKAAENYQFDAVDGDILPFIRDRMRVYLRDQNMRHDVVAAALADSSGDDLCRMADEARSLAGFLADGEGAGLMAGWRRVSSMLSAEEKKAKKSFPATIDPALFNDIEQRLHTALGAVPDSDVDFASKLTALGQLRLPIDAFFDGIVVNDDDPAIRLNRLGLLAVIREKMLMVADFSKIEG
ncbi:MAG: glycine--tRNA ligase subunit beta [Candidatus Puniceispirillaceae bacterium]|jgi:glycyl-tRNA synthetase beta chain